MKYIHGMLMKLKEILQLMAVWEEESGANTSEKDFALWLYKKHFSISYTSEESVNRKTAYLIQRIGRLGKILTKSAFIGTNLNSHEEFIMLNTVYNNNGISKQMLYQQAVFEMSTGSQIVKRLVGYHLLTEQPNETDKRVTNLFITSKGQKQRDLIFTQLKDHLKFKTSRLNNEQKKALLEGLEIIDQTMYEKFISTNND